MRIKVEDNGSFQEVKLTIADLKLSKQGGGGQRTLSGVDPQDERRKFLIDADSHELRILAVDFLDSLNEDEKTARHKLAESYRKKLGRGQ